MKRKHALMAIVATAFSLSVFAASTDFPIQLKLWEDLSQDLRVVNICDLTDHNLDEIMQGHCPEVAVEFSADTTLPISFFLRGDLLNLIEDEVTFGQIEIKQKFYARYVQGELILSASLTEWKPFLEFMTGHASVALSVHHGQPSIVFGAEINRRV